ncbi:MAG TPA: gamma-glutamyltransferase family protein [Candidatus Sulfotelmatobacter sp.]|nr:gamma-glutamyltransferase family protein [Candidatus Sulfotelmatobacter sp.]
MAGFTTRPVVMGTHGMVAAGHYTAALLGFEVLERGGNAIDAGVAAVFALALVKPYECGMGGECPILIFRPTAEADPNPVAVSGQGVAPRRATIDWFRDHGYDAIPGRGLLPATVPATFGALVTVLMRYGRLGLRETLGPVVELARAGYPLYPAMREVIAEQAPVFAAEWPTTGAVYLDDGTVPPIGTLVRPAAWAETFRAILDVESRRRRHGREAALQACLDHFYRGPVAQAVGAFVSRTAVADEEGRISGGLLEAQDLAAFQTTLEHPASFQYRGLDVYKCPPWSQGPVFLQQLALLQGLDLRSMGHNSAAYIHHVVEAAKLAFADRERYYGDPSFGDVPLEALLAPDYNTARRRLIDPDRASGVLRPGSVAAASGAARRVAGGPSRGAGDTTHIDAVDAAGNMFSATPSGGWFQSSPVVPELGFPLGTRAQQFNLQAGHPNALAPGKRPRTTLTPSLVLRDGAPHMVFGTEGGDNQDQWTLQFFLNVVEFGMDLQAAVDAPLVHSLHFPSSFYPHDAHPLEVVVEERLAGPVRDALSRAGHRVVVADDWSSGHVTAIRYTPGSGLLEGAASPRTMTAYAIGR